MDARKDTPSEPVQPHLPEGWVSNSGWALIWMDAIFFVPAIFGAMFLSDVFRVMILSVGVGLVFTYSILYSWARLHPASGSAHLLQRLHMMPRRPVTR